MPTGSYPENSALLKLCQRDRILPHRSRPRRFCTSAAGEKWAVTLLQEAAAQARSLGETGHRPYPLPGGRWVMGQTWLNLLFAHWQVAPELLRPHVPARLELDEHDGSAWIALTPFTVTGLRLRGMLPLPLVSQFDELNCPHVRPRRRAPGIWFFSLDASSRAAVAAARRVYELPYPACPFETTGDEVALAAPPETATFARRLSRHRGAAPRRSRARSSTSSPSATASTPRRRRRLRAEIHHPPWPLQPAQRGDRA